MTFSRFILFGVLLWLLLALVKGLFLQLLTLDSFPVFIGYLVVTVVIAMACSRRLGVINYLEGAFVACLWMIGVLIADWILLYAVLKLPVFAGLKVWFGYLAVMAGIFFFHKKRHVHIRNQQAHHHH